MGNDAGEEKTISIEQIKAEFEHFQDDLAEAENAPATEEQYQVSAAQWQKILKPSLAPALDQWQKTMNMATGSLVAQAGLNLAFKPVGLQAAEQVSKFLSASNRTPITAGLTSAAIADISKSFVTPGLADMMKTVNTGLSAGLVQTMKGVNFGPSLRDVSPMAPSLRTAVNTMISDSFMHGFGTSLASYLADADEAQDLLEQAEELREELESEELDSLAEEMFREHPDLEQAITESPALIQLSAGDKKLALRFIYYAVYLHVVLYMLQLADTHPLVAATVVTMGASAPEAAAYVKKKADKALDRVTEKEDDQSE